MTVRLDVDAGRRVMTLGRVAWLCRRAGVQPVTLLQTRSPGGQGWHLELTVAPAPRTCMEVAALQAVLGSDQGREACNINRARMVDTGRVSPWWAQRWNVLYG